MSVNRFYVVTLEGAAPREVLRHTARWLMLNHKVIDPYEAHTTPQILVNGYSDIKSIRSRRLLLTIRNYHSLTMPEVMPCIETRFLPEHFIC